MNPVPLRDQRPFWMRGTHKKGRCMCGSFTFGRLIWWDPVTRRTQQCWDCCPGGNRPDPTRYSLTLAQRAARYPAELSPEDWAKIRPDHPMAKKETP